MGRLGGRGRGGGGGSCTGVEGNWICHLGLGGFLLLGVKGKFLVNRVIGGEEGFGGLTGGNMGGIELILDRIVYA